MSDALVRMVYTTASSENEAAQIARTVVEEQLAACANIVPGIRSIYRWQGTVEDEMESLVFLKTAVTTVDRLIVRIRELHSYDVPDIVVVPIVNGHAPYLDWILENTTIG